MSSTDQTVSILDDSRRQERERVVGMLTQAYWMEIETVMNYVAGSINPDGVRARQIAAALEHKTAVTGAGEEAAVNRLHYIFRVEPGRQLL